MPELEKLAGRGREELLPNYLFVVGTGGNDYSFNHFLRRSNINVSLEAFTANLTNTLSLQLKVCIYFLSHPPSAIYTISICINLSLTFPFGVQTSFSIFFTRLYIIIPNMLLIYFFK